MAVWAADPDFQVEVGADFEIGFGENPIVEGSVHNALSAMLRATDYVVENMAALGF
jgi:hypothetical protein